MKEPILSVLAVEPYFKPCEEYLINEEKIIRFLICDGEDGQGLVEAMKIDQNICVMYNKNAEKQNYPPNRIIGDKTIYGLFYIVGIDDNNRLVSLTEDDIKRYRNI